MADCCLRKELQEFPRQSRSWNLVKFQELLNKDSFLFKIKANKVKVNYFTTLLFSPQKSQKIHNTCLQFFYFSRKKLKTYLQERMIEKIFEINSSLGVTFQQIIEQMRQFGGGCWGQTGRQPTVLLVELLQCLRSWSLKRKNIK